MAHAERMAVMSEIETLREGRRLICIFNFDRTIDPPIGLGLTTQFAPDLKECLFRVLKESKPKKGIDVCIYTRGGDVNAVWPIVSILREFDKNFEVVVPFRCHSAGTLAALGARTIILGPLSELSPIDPSTGNQFNPTDPNNPLNRLAISVEDVRAYKAFVSEQLAGLADRDKDWSEHDANREVSAENLRPYIARLTEAVHPLALGNVQRVLLQVRQLAKKLLKLHSPNPESVEAIVNALTTKFYSHSHMINRHEAREILGDRVKFADKKLSVALDRLLRQYEDSFRLRSTFYLNAYIKDEVEKDVRFIGGVVEGIAWSYLFETKAKIRQSVKVPPNIQIQVPPGQAIPLVPGLPREIQIEIHNQGWIHNKEPKGITV